MTRFRLALATAGALGLLAALPALAAAGPFRSPTGNIGCFIASAQVRCDIRDRTWSPPRTPASCHLDFGEGVFVARRGRGHFTCAGDTVLGMGRRLPYGSTIRRGAFRCTSRRSGMRCDNRRTGHGFVLSRQRVRLF